MTEPASYDPKTTAAVTLDGKLWPIPELGVRQLRRARRPIIDVTEAIEPKVDQERPDAPLPTRGELIIQLSTPHYEQMCEVVWIGLTRAHPGMTEEEFLSMRISDAEMFGAFLVVRHQSLIYRDIEPDSADAKPPAKPGEA